MWLDSLRALGGFGPIFRREVKAYLASPLFYVLVGIVLLAANVLFLFLVNEFAKFSTPGGRAEMPPGFSLNSTQFIIKTSYSLIHFFLLFTLPILSMRLIAEERRTGTLELLVTNPVRDWGLLLGKYFSSLAVVALILALTLPFPLAVEWLGGEPEWAVVSSCYVGLFFVSVAYLAFGLFASSLTESQVIAAILSYVGLFLLYVFGGLLQNAPNESVRKIGNALGVESHFSAFASGNIVLLDAVYFLLFAFLFLFLSAQVLGMRRWKLS